MLPSAHRMRRADDFDAAIRHGMRAGRSTVVVHGSCDPARRELPTLVGFVVSKQVGSAVERNRVKRRLRAIMAQLIAEFPRGLRLVVRALPMAAQESYRELAQQTTACVRSVTRKLASAAGSA